MKLFLLWLVGIFALSFGLTYGFIQFLGSMGVVAGAVATSVIMVAVFLYNRYRNND